MDAHKVYTIESSGCDCLLNLSSEGHTKQINLFNAIVYPINSAGDFRIQGLTSGVNVSADSAFDVAAIEALICSCINPV